MEAIVSALALSRNKGFTLVEVLMAVLILMVGMLGLLQAVNLAMEMNLRNQVREEAVYVGERVMNELKGRGFYSISSNYRNYSTPSRIRGFTKKYGVERRSSELATENGLPTTKQLEVTITWSYKGASYQNRVVAPISVLR